MNAATAYDELIRHRREEALLLSCQELLSWDELIFMPRAGAAHRSEQAALLTGLYHARATDPRIGELLASVEGSDLVRDGESPAAVNVREIRIAYDWLRRLPRTLVEELARVTSLAQQEWEIARANNDYRRFQPWLEKVVALCRAKAEALGYQTIAYDALLDEYEPGMRSTTLVELFTSLREALVPLAQALTHAPRKPNPALLYGDFTIDRQRRFGTEVAAALGFDFTAGRLDDTVHPFCSAVGPGDCRIATRYHAQRFGDGLFSILHEVGHGLYEQGLEQMHNGTPMGEVPSLGLHESQARLWENTVGRSRAFWQHFLPRAQAMFPAALGDVGLDAFYFAVNQVEASLIRVVADEVTYNLHILVRFDLERALVSGDLPTADLPAAWNEAYQHHLGVTPRNDGEGCLQDGHWGAGLLGYFPTYTLGNLFAAQLYAAAVAQLGDLEVDFARGRFDALRSWLQTKVYRHGHRYSATQLIARATGAAPNFRQLVTSLQRKYGELYGCTLPPL
jgi:carboxypeptidase Taq